MYGYKSQLILDGSSLQYYSESVEKSYKKRLCMIFSNFSSKNVDKVWFLVYAMKLQILNCIHQIKIKIVPTNLFICIH